MTREDDRAVETYPIPDPSSADRLVGFEIENVYLQPHGVALLLRGIAGVSNIRIRRLFASPSDIHVRFDYLGVPHVVWEPWADNSRYWIVPEEPGPRAPDIRPIEQVFRAHRLSLWRRTLGDLVSLKFITRAFRGSDSR